MAALLFPETSVTGTSQHGTAFHKTQVFRQRCVKNFVSHCTDVQFVCDTEGTITSQVSFSVQKSIFYNVFPFF